MISLGKVPAATACPVWFISSYGDGGIPNIMCASWCGIVSNQPLCVGVSVKTGALTHENIALHKAFTVGVASVDDIRVADIIGKHSGRQLNKYKTAGLTPVHSGLVNAPYPEQMDLIMECALLHTVPLGSHSQFIGEVLDVKASARIIKGNTIIPSKHNPLLAAGADRGYYRIGERIRDV